MLTEAEREEGAFVAGYVTRAVAEGDPLWLRGEEQVRRYYADLRDEAHRAYRHHLDYGRGRDPERAAHSGTGGAPAHPAEVVRDGGGGGDAAARHHPPAAWAGAEVWADVHADDDGLGRAAERRPEAPAGVGARHLMVVASLALWGIALVWLLGVLG